MNKFLPFILIFILFTLSGCEGDYDEGYFEKDNAIYYYTCDSTAAASFNCGPENKVEIALNTDKSTFQIIDNVYAKDKDNVWREGQRLDGVDPESFEKFYDAGKYIAYYKDKSHVFYEYYDFEYPQFNEFKVLPNADPENFNISAYPYGKDNKNVYYKNIKLDSADTGSFQTLPLPTKIVDWIQVGYATDQKNVYFEGNIIPNVDAQSFQQLNRDFFKDNTSIYVTTDEGKQMVKIQNADRESFQLSDYGFAKDKYHIYYRNTDNSENPYAIINLDPASFKIFYWSNSTIGDKNGIYRYNNENNALIRINSIEDPSSFKILKNGFSKDKYAVYNNKDYTKISDLDAASVQITDCMRYYEDGHICGIEDKNGSYSFIETYNSTTKDYSGHLEKIPYTSKSNEILFSKNAPKLLGIALQLYLYSSSFTLE